MRVYATTLAVPAGSTASSADAELIRDALWAHANALGDIEHITVKALPEGIGIAVFLSHLAESPQERVSALLKIAVRRSPLLSQWRRITDSEENFPVSDDPAGGPGNGADHDPCPGGG
jgi:hypothetical protein